MYYQETSRDLQYRLLFIKLNPKLKSDIVINNFLLGFLYQKFRNFCLRLWRNEKRNVKYNSTVFTVKLTEKQEI